MYTFAEFYDKRGCSREGLEAILQAEWHEHDLGRVLNCDTDELLDLEKHIAHPDEILLLDKPGDTLENHA
jgi:hypothetical protein